MKECSNRQPKKLRAACDACHQSKTKCSGENPCRGCLQLGVQCSYSVSHRIGRPKGARNKTTSKRVRRHQNKNDVSTDSEGRDNPLHGQLPVASQWPEEIWDSSIPTPALTDYDNSKDTPLSEAFLGNNFDNLLFPTNGDDLWSFFETPGSQDEPGLSSPTSSKISTSYNQGGTGSALITPAISQSKEHGPGKDSSAAVRIDTDVGTATACEIQSLMSFSDMYTPNTPLEHPLAENGVPTSFSPSVSQPCNCLKQNADVLCRLKSSKIRHASPSIDIFLVGADQALASWKGLLQCRNCRHSDDQEVLHLSVMSIRVLLRSLQNLCHERGEGTSSGEEFGMSNRHDIGVTASPCRANGVEMTDSVRSTIGVYEVKGVERTLISNLLISRTLGKIKVILRCLQERSESAMQKQRWLSGNMMEENTESLQQSLRNLDGTVQKHMQWLRSTVNGTYCDYGI